MRCRRNLGGPPLLVLVVQGSAQLNSSCRAVAAGGADARPCRVKPLDWSFTQHLQSECQRGGSKIAKSLSAQQQVLMLLTVRVIQLEGSEPWKALRGSGVCQAT